MAAGTDRFDVAAIARLAHLELTEEEQALFSPQLNDILGYVATLQAVDTDGVPPTSHAFADGDAWRADEPHPSLDRDRALAASPGGSPRSGLFKVPKVL